MAGFEHRGAFRVRPDEGGAFEVWAPGWRLETPAVALLPLALAFGVTLTPIGTLGATTLCVPLVACAFVLLRLMRLGIRFDPDGIELTGVLRSRRVAWDDVGGFMGHRTSHDGWVVLVTVEGERVRVPGSLSGEEMNPIGDEGDLSAVDQLNRMIDTFRRQVPSARLPVKVKAPRVRTRREPSRTATDVHTAATAEAQAPTAEAQPAAEPVRRPSPEPEEVKVGRTKTPRRHRYTRAERKAALAVPVIHIPEVEPMSPGARRLAEFERRRAERDAGGEERS